MPMGQLRLVVFKEALFQSRNAEEALLVALNACAQVTEHVTLQEQTSELPTSERPRLIIRTLKKPTSDEPTFEESTSKKPTSKKLISEKLTLKEPNSPQDSQRVQKSRRLIDHVSNPCSSVPHCGIRERKATQKLHYAATPLTG
jgi:hypothetical protein